MKAEIVIRPNQAAYAVIEVQSDSNPGVFYRVDVVNRRCSCPAWKFAKAHARLCKHLKRMGFTEPLTPANQGVRVVDGVEIL